MIMKKGVSRKQTFHFLVVVLSLFDHHT